MTTAHAAFARGILGIVVLTMLMWSPLPAASGDTEPASGLLHVRTGAFDPLALPQAERAAPGGKAAGSPASETVDHRFAYLIVQFDGPVEAAWLSPIQALGGEVLGYVPDNAHIVRVARSRAAPAALSAARFRTLPRVRWVGDYLPEYKITLDGRQRVAAAQSPGMAGVAAAAMVYAGSFPGEPVAPLEQLFASLGASVQAAALSPTGDVYQLSIPADAVPALLTHPAISWVEPVLAMSTSNAAGRKIMGVEKVWQDFGFYGAGQIIAVSDSGLSVQEALSPDFNGRLVRAFAPSEMNLASPQCKAKTTWTDLNGHGTHVAGSVLGNGTRSGSNAAAHSYASSHAGAAPEAQLVFMALNTDGSTGIQCIDLNGDFIAKGYQNGARISSNSWGANSGGGYNLLSSLVDDYIWRHKDYLVFFSAGNAGPGSQTVGSPGTAKNAFSVGASENDRADQDNQADNPNEVASFSSRGPTADGRIKPEVVVPGTWVLSARAAQAPDGSFWGNFNADYAFMGGTSMATPLTAGSAALVREWMAKRKGQANPSAALMKAIMINGAINLPGAATPNLSSGFGRVDIKNTLNANYAVMDDNVQGMQTGQSVTYTVQVVGTSAMGTLLTVPNDAPARNAQAANPLPGLALAQPAGSGPSLSLAVTAVFTGEALPGYGQGPQRSGGIATVAGAKPQAQTAAQLSITTTGQLPPLDVLRAGARAASAQSTRMLPRVSQETQSYLANLVGGGDFEDPDWTDFWQYVWLGSGLPVRTSDLARVINGQYSMWLGGSPSEDALFYPIAFPDAIDTSLQSFLRFNVSIYDQDIGNDEFCVALIDESGYFVGPYATGGPDCAETNGNFTYTANFTPQELATLAGESGYIALYTVANGVLPHTSALVDDVVFALDLPTPTAASTPGAGPAGTRFLLTSKYNVPYGSVDVCIAPCSTPANIITTVYADAYGSAAAYLQTATGAQAGLNALQTRDSAGRLANTSFTIVGGVTATLVVLPASGPQGATFTFSGQNFLPNDSAIGVTVNGESLGTVGSNAQGQITFTVLTQSNTPAGSYNAQVTDSAQRTASATYMVTALAVEQPRLVVAPGSGAPGSTFVFNATGFTPNAQASVMLDGQTLGQVNMNSSGGAELTLQTKDTIPPARYTLSVVQGAKQASAQYEITGGTGDPISGNGLYVTLVWTDPPAQASAAKTLVNDLDLSIAGPGGFTARGNGGASADRTNNVEAIRLENPVAGTYVITVRAQAVNAVYGAQPFALVATTRQNFGSTSNNQTLTPSGKKAVYLPLVRR